MSHNSNRSSRRQFLQTSAVAGAAAAFTPYIFSSAARAEQKAANGRHVIGCIGTGDRWKQFIPAALKYGDVVAVCDADRSHMEEGRAKVGGKAEMHEDYRKVLDNKDIDVITIGTPDHWHSKIAIEAMQAGKDVYCEKPLTLTIDEGKKICQVAKDTKRVFQVGTQQRSEMSGLDKKNNVRYPQQFLRAVALAQSGRLGKIQKVTCSIGGAPTSPAIPKAETPSGLNWDLWLGQAPLVDYVYAPSAGKWGHSRCHYEFRWWYEYSGGKLTDWGAHHVDIAQWAIGMDHSGPTSVQGTGVHPVTFKDGHPTVDNQYNTATEFHIVCKFPGDIEMVIQHGPDNGIWIEGDKGTIFVNRGTLEDIRGEAVKEMATNPISETEISKLYKGKKPGSHMGNFFECIADRGLPASDVFTHHRAMTTCHLANIAIRLGRPLKWDAEKEEIVGDADANQWLAREQRKGYEIKV